MDKIVFSIIIPTYNRGQRILKTINSVLNQDFKNYEIIVVDDGSIDDTEKLIFELNNQSIRYIKTVNLGVAHARNYGIKMAVGNYVGFLDSDDMMNPDHLQSAYNFICLKSYPEVVHLNFLWGDENKIHTLRNQLPKSLPEDIFKNCSLHVNCIFVKNEIIKNNLFNESRELMFAEDWDFFIKLAVRFEIHLLDKITAYLVDHEDRSMRNFDQSKWISKRDAIVLSLSRDEVVSKKYEHNIKTVEAHMNSLIAINLAIRKNKVKAIYFWFLSFSLKIDELFTRRSMAIIKHLVFNW